MDIKAIHPELRKAARRMPNIPIYHYWVLKAARVLGKLAYPSKVDKEVNHRDIQLSHEKVRVYSPQGETSGAAILWIHGGGMVMGHLEMNDLLCSTYVKELNTVVVSVDYRLAPEHPFPAGSDDCFEAWKWLLENADELGIDPNRIAIAGQSGGGCMAADLSHRILDAGGQQPAVQFLYCPMLDDRTAANTELDGIKHVAWNNRHNRAAWSWYLGCEAGSNNIPKNSVPARRENLSGLPPAWIGVGSVDLFYEEDKTYAERLQAAGVETTLDIVPQAFHGFEALALDTQVVEDFYSRHFNYARRALNINS